MMKHYIVLFVACVVIAYQLQSTSAQFSFSLPGKWGNGKRGVPSWAKRDGLNCGEMDTQVLLDIYKSIQTEAWRVNRCLQSKEDGSKQ